MLKKKKPFNENWKNKMGLFTIVNTDSNKIKVVWDTFIMWCTFYWNNQTNQLVWFYNFFLSKFVALHCSAKGESVTYKSISHEFESSYSFL